jgi:hypothetical protein
MDDELEEGADRGERFWSPTRAMVFDRLTTVTVIICGLTTLIGFSPKVGLSSINADAAVYGLAAGYIVKMLLSFNDIIATFHQIRAESRGSLVYRGKPAKMILPNFERAVWADKDDPEAEAGADRKRA